MRSRARELPRGLAIGIGAVVVVGVALRIATALQSFWLDEIWSYYLAQDLDSVWQVFSERRHDNNHILNTLFIAALGEWEFAPVYRTLSLATGVGSLWLMGAIARRRGAAEALAAVALGALSFPLVVASAQARGYAPAIFFGLAALWWACDGGVGARRSAGRVAGFWAICALGFLSHLTFLYAYLGVLAWSGADALRVRTRAGWLEWLRWHALPLALLAALYAGFYSEIVIGGGDRDWAVGGVVQQVLGAATLASTRAGVLAPALAAAAFGAGLWTLRDDAGRPWIFYACAIALAPALLLVVATPRLLYPRYFWAALPFLYLLAAFALGRVWALGRAGRAASAALLAAFAAVHGAKHAEHIAEARPNYAETLAYLEQHTAGDTIHVGTDHDFRNAMVLRFYARYSEAHKAIAIRAPGTWVGAGPEWYLAHSWLAGRNPPEHLTLEGGRTYTLVARFDHGIGYGWTWYVYRNDATR